MDDRDPVVARALAELPPPPHRPDFWHRLDRALAEAAPPQPATAPAPPPASEPEPADDAEVVVLHRAPADERSARARRAARFPLRLLASAAVIVAVVAAGVLVAGRGADDSGPDLSTAGPSNTAADGTGSSAAPETTAPATTAPTSIANASPDGVVLAFISAVGAGVHDAAASVIGPISENAMIERFGSVDAYLYEASEGHGAWSASEDRQVDVVELREGEAVVVLRGTIHPEGMEEYRVAAFPTRRAESAGAFWFVEPLAGGETTALLDEALRARATQGIANGEPVEITVPSAGTVYFALGDQDAVAVPTSPRGAAHVATWTPAGAPAGEFVLTVAFVADGTFAAVAAPVTVR